MTAQTDMTTPRIARRTRAATVLGAVVTALAVWAIAVHLAGAELTIVDPDVPARSSTIGAVMVATVALAAGLAALGLFAALRRFGRRGATIWTVSAVVVFVVSLVGPATAPGLTGSARSWLMAMHVVVAAVIIAGFRRSLR